jgi:hypothetical protein
MVNNNKDVAYSISFQFNSADVWLVVFIDKTCSDNMITLIFLLVFFNSIEGKRADQRVE